MLEGGDAAASWVALIWGTYTFSKGVPLEQGPADTSAVDMDHTLISIGLPRSAFELCGARRRAVKQQCAEGPGWVRPVHEHRIIERCLVELLVR